jgi:hypothetical protein
MGGSVAQLSSHRAGCAVAGPHRCRRDRPWSRIDANDPIGLRSAAGWPGDATAHAGDLTSGSAEPADSGLPGHPWAPTASWAALDTPTTSGAR